MRWEIPFLNVSVLFYTELKTKGKGRREKRRFIVVSSSPPSVPSSLLSLAVVCHLSGYYDFAIFIALNTCWTIVLKKIPPMSNHVLFCYTSLLRRRVPHLVVYLIGRVRVMALVVELFLVSSSVASTVYNANLLSLLKSEINNLQSLLSTSRKNVRRGIPDATLADACYGVERAIPVVVLVRCWECLSRLISSDVVPDAMKNIDISFLDVFVRREYPRLL
uniref:Uncharacterized protein n=1 Tax=Cucumis melo TaxID=3656 RepID=A0A9I9EM94_CUCME